MSNTPDQKKGMSGCAIAAIVVGALLVLGCVAIGVGVVFFMRSDAGHAMSDTMSAAANAKTGPAVDALTGAGCTQATSMDLSSMANMARSFAKTDAEEKAAEQMRGLYEVSCVSGNLTCEQVAQAWGKAAPANASHAIVTVSTGPGQNACSGHYDRSGTKLPDIAPPKR